MTKIGEIFIPAKDFTNFFSYFIHEYDVVDLQIYPFSLLFLQFVEIFSHLV